MMTFNKLVTGKDITVDSFQRYVSRNYTFSQNIIIQMFVCDPMKIDRIKPGELKIENMCARENVRAQHSGDGFFGLEIKFSYTFL